MSSISFSAPSITPEEEQAELDAFTEAERVALASDMYGHSSISNTSSSPSDSSTTSSLITSSAEGLQNATRMLREALHSIPQEEKAEYLEALRRAPEIVLTVETNPITFLHVSNFDPWAAAKRIAAYWKLRREIFGSDVAFLPMTLDGAMNQDSSVLELGHLAILPPDNSGRPVFWVNRTKLTKAIADRKAFLRVLFYFFTALSLMENCQTNGFLKLINLRGFDMHQHFDRVAFKKLTAMRNLIPFARPKGAHFVLGSGNRALNFVLPFMKYLMGRHNRHRLVLHDGSDQTILSRLEEYGMARGSLCSTIGGAFDHERFREWLENQRSVERERYQAGG